MDDSGKRGDGRDGLARVMGDGVVGHERESMAMVERAVRNGWNIPDEWCRELPAVAAAIAVDASCPRRDRLRALGVLMSMRRHNVEAAVALDHMERLEAGRATAISEDKLTKQQLSLVQVLVQDRLEGRT